MPFMMIVGVKMPGFGGEEGGVSVNFKCFLDFCNYG